MNTAEFSERVLRWYDHHGRKDLPWQQQATPYRVWISEIMLQQTQVTTVIRYYQRFMARFPDLITLANAPLDEVLHLWSGLGYYARARNLHRSATILRDQYGGQLPLDLETLHKLPGIGRSTAGAILALATGQRHPILDGNVKRVLSRFQAVEGWPGDARVSTILWDLAQRYTPSERVAEYTQAMMDLGALLCTRRHPRCLLCPLADSCAAHLQGRATAFPMARPRKALPVRQTRLLMLRTPEGRVLLEKRPPLGIWGGLWSFPECPLNVDVRSWCRNTLHLEVNDIQAWSVLRHTFSHFHLDITPLAVTIETSAAMVMEAERLVWYNTQQPDERGLAAPVQKLLSILTTELARS
jgi:A/G-specific adenine glycosylase